MSTTGLCRDCKYWDDGECRRVDHGDPGFGWKQNPRILFEVEAKALDDSGLSCRLLTGPEFGCVKFEQAEPIEEDEYADDE